MVFDIDIFVIYSKDIGKSVVKIDGKSQSGAIQVSITACFKKQASDDNEQSSQSSHSEDDPLDNNEDFDLDNSASSLGLDNM